LLEKRFELWKRLRSSKKELSDKAFFQLLQLAMLGLKRDERAQFLHKCGILPQEVSGDMPQHARWLRDR
jgi:hypothetical protein